MFPSGVQCTHKMFQIYFHAFAAEKSPLHLSAIILPVRQMMICCWTRQCRSKLEMIIVLIHVQVSLCRCNRAKYNLAQLIGNNSLKIYPTALHECISIYVHELRIRPQISLLWMAQNSSVVLLHSLQHQELLHVKKKVMASQSHARPSSKSPGSI